MKRQPGAVQLWSPQSGGVLGATAWVGDGPAGDSFRLDGEQHRCRIFAASTIWDLLIPNTWGVADTGRWKLYARAYGVYCAGPDYEETCISQTKALHKWLCSEYIAGAHAGLQQRLIATPVLDGETPAATRLSCECRSFEIWCATVDCRTCPTCSEQHIVGGVGAGSSAGHPQTLFKGSVAEVAEGAECIRCATRQRQRKGKAKTPEVFSKEGGFCRSYASERTCSGLVGGAAERRNTSAGRLTKGLDDERIALTGNRYELYYLNLWRNVDPLHPIRNYHLALLDRSSLSRDDVRISELEFDGE